MGSNVTSKFVHSSHFLCLDESQFPGGNYLRHKMSDHTFPSFSWHRFSFTPSLSLILLFPSTASLSTTFSLFAAIVGPILQRNHITLKGSTWNWIVFCTFINYLSRKERRRRRGEKCQNGKEGKKVTGYKILVFGGLKRGNKTGQSSV